MKSLTVLFTQVVINLVALSLLLSAVDEAVRIMPVHFSSDSSLCPSASETRDAFRGACGKENVGDVHGESTFQSFGMIEHHNRSQALSLSIWASADDFPC